MSVAVETKALTPPDIVVRKGRDRIARLTAYPNQHHGEQIRREIENTSSDYDREKLQERLGQARRGRRGIVI